MGFRLDRTYKLRWDDEAHPLSGLEIDLRSCSVATLAEMRALRVGQGDEARLVDILIQHVRRWNFEDEDGAPLPVTAESLLSQEPVVLAEIGREWYLAAAGVSAPLVPRSTSTDTSAEESIPMETL